MIFESFGVDGESPPRLAVVAQEEETGCRGENLFLLQLGGPNQPLRLFVDSAEVHSSVGQELWGSGLVLTQFLLHRKAELEGKRVWELGSGTGVTGLSVAPFARETRLTDRAVPSLLANLRRNLAANHERGGSVAVEAWDWCEQRSIPRSVATTKADIIIGADIIYDSLDSLCALLQTLHRHLAWPEGIFYGVSPANRGLVPELTKLSTGCSGTPNARLKEAAEGLVIDVDAATPAVVEAAGEPSQSAPVSRRRVQSIGAHLGLALPDKAELPKRLLVDSDKPYCVIRIARVRPPAEA